MTKRADVAARGLRRLAWASLAGVALTLVGQDLLAAPSRQPIAAPFIFSVATPAAAPPATADATKPSAPPADCGMTPDGFSAWLEGFKQEAEIEGVAAGGHQLGTERRRLRS